MNLKKSLVVFPALVMLGACSDSTDYDFEASQTKVEESQPAVGGFDLSSDPPNLPFPNMLLFGADGTLNVPLDDGVTEANVGNPSVALNALDGFSTTQPITANFDGPMNPDSFVLGETVRVFEVSANPQGAVGEVVAELGATDVAVALTGESTLAIIPVQPLKESTDYMVIVTNGVENEAGVATAASTSFRLVSGPIDLTPTLGAEAEAIRELTRTYVAAADSQDIDAADIILAWGIRTQSITPTLSAVATAAETFSGNLTMVPSGQTTKPFLDPLNQNPAVTGSADVYIGTLDIPYYRTAPASANDPVGVVSFWQPEGGGNITQFQPMPAVSSTQTIPVLMSVPNAASGATQPEAGWPVVIFVHGITQDRTNMLPVAESMARAGFAVVAIDHPMHGVFDSALDSINAANTPFPNDAERHFNLDVFNAAGQLMPDGTPESSGFHFYSPGNLLASRDNLRQAASDQLVLSANIGSLPFIDGSRKAVVGHSLGGVVATTFLAFDTTISSATLAMPAAGLAPMLVASENLGPDLIAAIEAQGIDRNSSDFAQLILVAQTVIDSGDSINHAAAAAQNTPIHMIEVIGDATVPNNVATAPLSGTDPLARMMGFDPANPISANFSGPGLVKFIEGDHSSILLPNASVAATVEMQTQTATFAATGGTQIVITDPSVIEGGQ